MTDRGAGNRGGEGVLIFAVFLLDPFSVVFWVIFKVLFSNRLRSLSAFLSCLVISACSSFSLFDSAVFISLSNRLRSLSAFFFCEASVVLFGALVAFAWVVFSSPSL
jgi:hypothetical protein